MCSASGHVLQMPLWASTRRSERFLSTRREDNHANGVFLYGSPWKAHRATVRNSDGCMRLWENAVDRKGVGKMLPPWSVRKTDGPPNIISPTSGRSGTCSFLRGFPTLRERLSRFFPRFAHF